MTKVVKMGYTPPNDALTPFDKEQLRQQIETINDKATALMREYDDDGEMHDSFVAVAFTLRKVINRETLTEDDIQLLSAAQHYFTDLAKLTEKDPEE